METQVCKKQRLYLDKYHFFSKNTWLLHVFYLPYDNLFISFGDYLYYLLFA